MRRDPPNRGHSERPSLAGPPRTVLPSVCLRILTGGFHSQFGWLFFGFGMFFVWMFVVIPVAGSPRPGGASGAADENRVRIQATITRIEATAVQLRGRPVLAYHYERRAAGGEAVPGVFHDFKDACAVGETITLSHPPGEPQKAAIVRSGCENAVGFQPLGLVVLIFPIVGLCFVTVAIRKGLRGIRLLRDGKEAVGRLIGLEPTNTTINDQRVYRFTFHFTADDGQTYKAEAKTHLLDRFSGVEADGQPLVPKPPAAKDAKGKEPEEEVYEPLLYDPADPNRAILLDDLPGEPRIDENGEIRTRRPFMLLLTLIIPFAAVVGHAMVALRLLLGR